MWAWSQNISCSFYYWLGEGNRFSDYLCIDLRFLYFFQNKSRILLWLRCDTHWTQYTTLRRPTINWSSSFMIHRQTGVKWDRKSLKEKQKELVHFQNKTRCCLSAWHLWVARNRREHRDSFSMEHFSNVQNKRPKVGKFHLKKKKGIIVLFSPLLSSSAGRKKC